MPTRAPGGAWVEDYFCSARKTSPRPQGSARGGIFAPALGQGLALARGAPQDVAAQIFSRPPQGSAPPRRGRHKTLPRKFCIA